MIGLQVKPETMLQEILSINGFISKIYRKHLELDFQYDLGQILPKAVLLNILLRYHKYINEPISTIMTITRMTEWDQQ